MTPIPLEQLARSEFADTDEDKMNVVSPSEGSEGHDDSNLSSQWRRCKKARRDQCWGGWQSQVDAGTAAPSRCHNPCDDQSRPKNVTLVPMLCENDYIDDNRFARLNKPDPQGLEGCKQYVCDACLAVCSRKSAGCPSFDGQYVNLDLLEGPRGPFDLKKAWLGGWDASWLCTACWCIKLWQLRLPLQQDDKVQMRFLLGIVTKPMLDALRIGSKKYKSQRSSGSGKHFANVQQFAHDASRHDDVSLQGRR